MWWENDLGEASLASVGNIFQVDKETVLPEYLLTKDSQHPVGFRFETISQKLTAGVVRLDTGLKLLFSFEDQSGIDPALRCEWQSLIA
jgi:hypothetical protein